MLQFFLGCKMWYWTKPQSQMYMNLCKCSTEIINDVIAVLRRHFCFFVFFLCSSVTSLLFFEFCVVLLLFHVELFSARAFESVRRSSLQYRITSLLQFNMAWLVLDYLKGNLFYKNHVHSAPKMTHIISALIIFCKSNNFIKIFDMKWKASLWSTQICF